MQPITLHWRFWWKKGCIETQTCEGSYNSSYSQSNQRVLLDQCGAVFPNGPASGSIP